VSRVDVNRWMTAPNDKQIYLVVRELVKYLRDGEDRVAILWVDRFHLKHAQAALTAVLRSPHYRWLKIGRFAHLSKWGRIWKFHGSRSSLIMLEARRAAVAVCGTYYEIDKSKPLQRPKYYQEPSEDREYRRWKRGWEQRLEVAWALEDDVRRRRRISDLHRERRTRLQQDRDLRERRARCRKDVARDAANGRKAALAVEGGTSLTFDMVQFPEEGEDRLPDREDSAVCPASGEIPTAGGEQEAAGGRQCGVGVVSRPVS
jgi:hypothetical protein